MFSELKNRGVEDILIASVDGLTGFMEAINTAFPKTEVQGGIIHQIRSSARYVSYKDLKEFARDLKPIYRAPSEGSGLTALDDLEKKWGAKYPMSVKSWRNNWNELATFFEYSPLIRKLIYTTNAVENFHRQLRKVTKTKSAFVSEGALMKILYLTTVRIIEKWTQPVPNWG